MNPSEIRNRCRAEVTFGSTIEYGYGKVEIYTKEVFGLVEKL